MADRRLIETDDFAFEFLSRLAHREAGGRKSIDRCTMVHKWWAKRLGTVFRGILPRLRPGRNRGSSRVLLCEALLLRSRRVRSFSWVRGRPSVRPINWGFDHWGETSTRSPWNLCGSPWGRWIAGRSRMLSHSFPMVLEKRSMHCTGRRTLAIVRATFWITFG